MGSGHASKLRSMWLHTYARTDSTARKGGVYDSTDGRYHHEWSDSWCGERIEQMRFGVCASFQEVATLETMPFDFLEENVQQFLIPERPQADFEALLREARRLPVPIETAYAFLPGDLNLVATPQQQVDTVRLERYVKTALQRAEQVGIRVIGFGSAVARSCPEGYDHDDALQQIEEHLATWNAWAGEYGIQIPMEPMAYEVTNVVNTIAEGGALISRIATTGARLLADTYHMGRNHEDPETLLPVGPLLGHVHVAELGLIQTLVTPGAS